MIDFLSEAQQIAPELTALRHAFHMEPELGNHEFNTASRIEAALNGWDIPTRRLLDTAVAGRLDGALPGPTVALRADMDALPLTEATGADFASGAAAFTLCAGSQTGGAVRVMAGDTVVCEIAIPAGTALGEITVPCANVTSYQDITLIFAGDVTSDWWQFSAE